VTLRPLPPASAGPGPGELARAAVLGIGQELRGDDAAGVEVVRRLKYRLGDRPHVLLIDAGPAPEAFTGPIRKFQPQVVFMIDAALMGLQPGQWREVDWRDTSNYSGSTHTLPLNILGEFLESETGCQVRLLGIQPQANDLGDELSRVVDRAIDEVVQALVDSL
jgi:hydrogenase 3 maturation protease